MIHTTRRIIAIALIAVSTLSVAQAGHVSSKAGAAPIVRPASVISPDGAAPIVRPASVISPDGAAPIVRPA